MIHNNEFEPPTQTTEENIPIPHTTQPPQHVPYSPYIESQTLQEYDEDKRSDTPLSQQECIKCKIFTTPKEKKPKNMIVKMIFNNPVLKNEVEKTPQSKVVQH